MPDIDVAQVLLSFVVLLFSLTVHESAHAWTADRLGDPTARILGRVSLNPLVHADFIGTVIFPLVAMTTSAPLIGWAKPVPVSMRQLRNPRRDFMLVAAAGPASNLAMAIAAYLAMRVLPVSPMQFGEPNLSGPVASMLSQALRLNLVLAIFNLMPIPPLDGGNILAGLLPVSAARIFNKVRPYGFVLLYVLMFTGGLNLLVFGPTNFVLRNLP